MNVESARHYFDLVASHPLEPRLEGASGTCEFDIEGAGVWIVSVDHGVLKVSDSTTPPANEPTTRVRVREDEFLRLARGEGHQNILTTLIRGALTLEGDLAFGQELSVILPAPQDWRISS